MRHLHEITDDGFNLRETKEIDLALLSLKIALKAYFSTYQTFKISFGAYEDAFIKHQERTNKAFNLDKWRSSLHTTNYCEACAECIVHFQHFTELVCKKFLQNDHPVLSTIAPKDHIVLHKLVHNQPLMGNEHNKVNTIECGEALNRLESLIKGRVLKDYLSVEFMLSHMQALNKLNQLRNRVWHGGVYVLHYRALDEFVGRFILPFVCNVINHPDFSGESIYWKYGNICCGIDPIKEIINSFDSEGKYDMGKVALLKEIGRAAYNNELSGLPLKERKLLRTFTDISDFGTSTASETVANALTRDEQADVTDCPVCGIKSLVQYQDCVYAWDEDAEMEVPSASFTYKVKCVQCTFNIEGGINSPSSYGFTMIPDAW